MKIHDVFHISLLRFWKHSNFISVAAQGDSEDLEDPTECVYEVEKVLRWWKRKIGNNMIREFLTLWLGYPLEEATWELEENFTYQDQLLEDVEAGEVPKEK